MLDSVTPSDLRVIRALTAGAQTALEVTAIVGSTAWRQLRSMELCEPSLVTSCNDPSIGEVWSATALGLSALGRAAGDALSPEPSTAGGAPSPGDC